jgi:hypothetical protein
VEACSINFCASNDCSIYQTTSTESSLNSLTQSTTALLPLALDQCLPLKPLVGVAATEARVLHVGEVPFLFRHPDPGDGGARVLPELGRVDRIVFGGEDLP